MSRAIGVLRSLPGKLPRNGRVRLGLAIFVFFIVMAALGPWFVTNVMHQDPNLAHFDAISKPPSWRYPLGTTTSGQYILPQLIAGSQDAVFVGILSGLIGTGMAALVGVTAGFFGGIADRLLNSFTNLVMTLPSLVLLIIVIGYVQNPSVIVMSLIIGLFEWPYGARYLRAQTLSIRERDFVVALESIAEKRWRIITVEVLPHLTGILSSMFLRAVIAGVFAQSALAFLGLGGSNASWGNMIGIAEGQNAFSLGYWWWYVPPGVCIALLGMATALINFGIDEVSNPALRNASPKMRKAMRKAMRATTRQPA